jgi:protein-S-isoprenylcysteine O-methyltransferase Ste14
MTDQPSQLLRGAIAGIIRLTIGMGLIAWGLFWAADTMAWPQAWWFIFIFVAELFIGVVYLWRTNPEIFAARRGLGAGTKAWDFIFLAIIIVGFTAILHVAGFDHRLGWAPMPVWISVLGHLVLAAGFGLITWAQGVNRHFEPSVRIQSDRGHTVVDTGPYAHVRHPGYIGGSLVLAGMALALGSLWALIPAVIVIAALVVRTRLEEKTLREGLVGYLDYTMRVRSRWIPGVW